MRLPALEVADLSFNIYMEAAASMDAWATEGYPRIQRVDARWDKWLGEAGTQAQWSLDE